MKRLFTFLALCCLVVTGAWAVDELGSLKHYNELTAGMKIALQGCSNTNSGYLYFSTNTVTSKDEWDETCTFILETASSGKYYLKNESTSKYIASGSNGQNCSLTESSGNAAQFSLVQVTTGGDNDLAADLTDVTRFDIGGTYLNCQTLKGTAKFANGTGSWSFFKVYEVVAATAKTYTVNITGTTGATVTYKEGSSESQTAGHNETITAAGLVATDLTASAVDGYTYTITIDTTNNIINVKYAVAPITSISELSNTKAYTITSYARGQWTAVSGKTEIYQTKGTDGTNWGNASNGYTPIDSDPTSANQQWAILKSSQNHYYLYNVGLKKFFVTSTSKATLADTPDNSTFTITDRANALTGDAKTNYTNSGNTVRFALSIEANSTTNYFGVTDWNGQQWKVFQNNGDYNKNSDKGMYFKIVPVEDFNPSEAMAKINVFEGVGDPITYTISADGKPDCVTVTIEGNEITGTWAQGIEYETYKQLSNTDVVVTTDDGYVATYTVDNNNHQINFDFNQIFVPIAHDGNLTTATKYLIKNGDNYYLKYDNGNLPGTQTRSEADKYVFVKHATQKGKYYIYSVGAEKYLTYTSTGNGSSTKTQTSSKVQLVANQADAKCWTFDNQICITPEDGGNAGLNFMGGADAGYVMNLYLNSDRNSKWQIIDSSLGSLACAVTMFSKPGAEYMHKLIPEEGVTVTGLELLDGLTGLELKTDRQSKGNGYAYVYGTAPSKGVYHYNVLLSDNTKARVTLTVSDFLQAPTPGMQWVSWNWFESNINAQKMTAIADGLVAKGLVDAGYKTIVLDDAWGTGTKDANNQWIPSSLTNNPSKFPDMASFVQTINGKGIRVGLYSDAAKATCGGYQPGSIGVEANHVAMFEGWGIDFLKYDFCGGSNAPQSYKTMGDAIAALNATREAAGNRVPFVFNACEWGQNSPHLWGAESGTSMWRATSDARECWLGTEGFPGVLAGSDRVRTLWMYAGVNRFNDLDMMCIGLHGLGGPSNHIEGHGNGGVLPNPLTDEQARSQMSIWSMLASPLSLSCDVRENPAADGNTSAGTLPNPLITQTDIDILTNEDILSISQDPLGQQAEYMASLGTANTKYQATGIDVYVKDMAEGKMALAVVNRNANGTATSQTISLNNIYLDGSKTYYVRDVWATSNKNFTVTDGQIVTGELAASQTKVYIISEEPFEEEAVTFVTTSTSDSKTYYTIQNVRTMGENNGANPAYVTAPSAGACMTQASTVTDKAVWYFEDATADVTDVDLTLYQPVYIRNLNYEGYLSCPRNNEAANASFTTTDTKQIFYLSQWTNAENPNGYLCVTTEPRTTTQNTATERIAWADKNDDGQYINYYVTQDGGTSFLFTEYVAPTSYTYDITITANGANVSSLKIDNAVYAAGEATFDHAIQESDVTVTEEAGYSYTLTITQPSGDTKGTIVLTYAKEGVDLSVAGTYYVYLKNRDNLGNVTYLYSDHASYPYETQQEATIAATEKLANDLVWRLVSDGTNVTITNGQGFGYLPGEGFDEVKSVPVANFNWITEEVKGYAQVANISILHSKNDECVMNGTYQAWDGGFFLFSDKKQSWMGPSPDEVHDGDFVNIIPSDIHTYTITESGQDFRSPNLASDHNDDETEWTLTYRFFYENEAKETVILTRLIYEAFMNVDKVGYCKSEDIDYEEKDVFDMSTVAFVYSLLGSYFHPADYYDMLESFNEFSLAYEVIQPQPGQAFRMAVRTVDCTKQMYLTDEGTLTDDAAEAAIFVAGSSSDGENYNKIFASNNNNKLLYLNNTGAVEGEYTEGTCDFKLVPMNTIDDEHGFFGAYNDPAHRFGTFYLEANNYEEEYSENYPKAVIMKENSDGTYELSTEFSGPHMVAPSDDPDGWIDAPYTTAVKLEEVDYPYTKPNLVSGTGDGHAGVFASVWLPFPMVIPDGIEVYKGTQERTVKGDPYLGLTQVSADENQCYAAGGYILYSSTVAAGQTLVLPANSVPTDARVDEDAAFAGSTEDPENYKGAINPETWEENTTGDIALWTAFLNDHADSTPYVLSNKSKGMGFYKYTGNSFPKGKAIWLKPADSSDAECVQLSFDDIISAIEALHGNTTNAEIFDLQGRRLDKVQKGQVNVINGQKIMFK